MIGTRFVHFGLFNNSIYLIIKFKYLEISPLMNSKASAPLNTTMIVKTRSEMLLDR